MSVARIFFMFASLTSNVLLLKRRQAITGVYSLSKTQTFIMTAALFVLILLTFHQLSGYFHASSTWLELSLMHLTKYRNSLHLGHCSC